MSRRRLRRSKKILSGSLKWVSFPISVSGDPSSNPVLPHGAVAGGLTDEGEVTYIACTRFHSHYRSYKLSCGAYIPSRNAVSIPYEYTERTSMSSIDILVCYDPEILYWVDASNGEVPNLAVCINKTKKRTDIIYIARTRPNTPLTGLKTVDSEEIVISDQFKGPMLGKLDPYHDQTMYLGYKGLQYKVSHYQVLCAYVPPPVQYLISSPYSWVPASDGYVPENALVGGLTKDGKQSYVAGVEYDLNSFKVGYVVPTDKLCYFPGDLHFDISSNSYHVLVPSNPSDFSWNAIHPSFDVGNANLVHAKSHQSDSSPFDNFGSDFIGRTKPGFKGINNLPSLSSFGGDMDESQKNVRPRREYPEALQAVGTVVFDELCVSYENELLQFDEYEALLVGKVLNSLQELCRYAILEYTFGVPDRINSLPLPTKMKEFCQLRLDESHMVRIDPTLNYSPGTDLYQYDSP